MQIFFKLGIGSFPRGDKNLMVKIQSRNLNKKFLISITTWPISTKLCTKNSLEKGIQVCLNDGSRPFPKGNNNEIAEIE